MSPSAQTMSPSKVLPDIAWLIFLAVGYFIAARIGIALTLEPEGLAAIWPASGIALAALLLCEPRRWPATLAVIFFVNILSNLTGGKALPVSLGFALANTLEPALGGWIMRRVCGPKITFGRISEVMALLGVAVLSNGVTALIGAAVPAVAFGAPYFHVF